MRTKCERANVYIVCFGEGWSPYCGGDDLREERPLCELRLIPVLIADQSIAREMLRQQL